MSFVDLSHAIEDGMQPYPGLPKPVIGALLTHEQSRPRYNNQAEFYLGRVDMPCNVGTYLDSPFHRYPDRADLSQISLDQVARLPGIVFDAVPAGGRAVGFLWSAGVDPDGFPSGLPAPCSSAARAAERSLSLQAREAGGTPALHTLAGCAVLFRTGWDERWGTDRYWEPGPFLSHQAIDLLVRSRPALVGVDFWNADNTEDPARPAHTRLLDAGILIVENLANIGKLPPSGFRFSAVPLPIRRGASFPVRAFAEL